MVELQSLQKWDEVYARYDVNDLTQERKTIEDAILETSKAELQTRLANGQYEVLNQGTTYSGEHFNPFDVYWVSIPPGGPVQKVSLPETFTEVYDLKALSAWLQEQIYSRRRIAARK